MPVNHKKCRRYRDTWAAPGSQLFEALEAGDRTRADRIYTICEMERSAREGTFTALIAVQMGEK